MAVNAVDASEEASDVLEDPNKDRFTSALPLAVLPADPAAPAAEPSCVEDETTVAYAGAKGVMK